MPKTADAHAHRLEQARRLLEEAGYTANGDGSYSPPAALVEERTSKPGDVWKPKETESARLARPLKRGSSK
jgi:methylmalonyl-CoA mutase cobalamin-binding subunit